MSFRLHGAVEGVEATYGDDAEYHFDHGVLVVRPGDGRRLTYSPNAWTYIEEPEPEAPEPVPGHVPRRIR